MATGSVTSVSSSLDRLVEALPALTPFHAPASPTYEFLALVAREQVPARFGPDADRPQRLEPFGRLAFPYHRMGAIDSVDLFGLDELILFAFYWSSRDRYRRVLDAGANLGLHSIVLNRCGYEVQSYEPDPEHFRLLGENLAANACSRTTAINAAVSDQDGEEEFIRVIGNTTSSHLAGSKGRPYGELERFRVKIASIRPLMRWADLVKLDVEGHERQIVCATASEDWELTDMVLEVGTRENAEQIFQHCTALKLDLYAQRNGWAAVRRSSDMPTSYRDGSLFVTRRAAGPWS